MTRKNKNRTYQQLWVWQDAKALFGLTWRMLKQFPPELMRVKTNQLAAVDSVQRNIAEGNCLKSVKEYLKHLNYSRGSIGEAVASMMVYRESGLFSAEEYETWDALAYKLENGLLRLIEKLEAKRDKGDWEDTLGVEDINVIYQTRDMG